MQLLCPSCGSPSLQLDATTDDERETREGRLHRRSCQLERPVRDGVADLMLDPSPEVRAEAEGLERFALQMRRGGWDRTRVTLDQTATSPSEDTTPQRPGRRIRTGRAAKTGYPVSS